LKEKELEPLTAARKKITRVLLTPFFLDPVTDSLEATLKKTSRQFSDTNTHYYRFYNLQILTYTFKIATSFFSTASSLCGKRSLSMTFIATSLFVDLCKPVPKQRNNGVTN